MCNRENVKRIDLTRKGIILFGGILLGKSRFICRSTGTFYISLRWRRRRKEEKGEGIKERKFGKRVVKKHTSHKRNITLFKSKIWKYLALLCCCLAQSRFAWDRGAAMVLSSFPFISLFLSPFLPFPLPSSPSLIAHTFFLHSYLSYRCVLALLFILFVIFSSIVFTQWFHLI